MSLETTYRRERKKILAWLARRVADPEDAEDLLQDAFVAASAEFDAISSVEYLLGYVYAVLRNKVVDWYRRKKVSKLADSSIANELALNEIADGVAGPERQFYQKIVLQELAIALEELPAEQRIAFLGNVVEGKTLAEISKESGVPEGTIAARKSYARDFLIRRLSNVRTLFFQEF